MGCWRNFGLLVLGCVQRTAGNSIIWNYADPLTSLELLNYYLTLAMSSGRFCILCHSTYCVLEETVEVFEFYILFCSVNIGIISEFIINRKNSHPEIRFNMLSCLLSLVWWCANLVLTSSVKWQINLTASITATFWLWNITYYV